VLEGVESSGFRKPASTMTGGSSVGDWAQFEPGLIADAQPAVARVARAGAVLEGVESSGFRAGGSTWSDR